MNVYTYRGYQYDKDTGFYYLQSRYYDPEVGRFLNADDTNYLGATGTTLGYNLYSYCENNGVNFIDETGNARITIILSRDFLRDCVTASVCALGTIIGAAIVGWSGPVAIIAGAIGAALGWIVGGVLSRAFIKKDLKFSVSIPFLRESTYRI